MPRRRPTEESNCTILRNCVAPHLLGKSDIAGKQLKGGVQTCGYLGRVSGTLNQDRGHMLQAGTRTGDEVGAGLIDVALREELLQIQSAHIRHSA